MSFFGKRKAASAKKQMQRALGGYRVPQFPAVAMKAMKLLRNDSVSLQDVADIIILDPGISAAMLSLVNSASHALKRPVDTVQHATALLGRSQVESLLVAAAVGRTLPAASKYLDMAAFWRTSARRAAIASGFAARLHPTTLSTSYTAGLLQDMAIPILMESKKNDYATLYRSWQNGEAKILEEERSRYHWDHAEVASWMCKEWHFPEALNHAIETHHHPLGDSSAPAVRLVSMLRCDEDSRGIDAVVAAATQAFDISSDACVQIIEVGAEQGDATAKLFH